MKKLFKILLAVSTAISLTACSSSSSSKKTLKVYNVGEYMDKSLISKFESEYNCKVVYETYESNEVMYTKISAGGNEYDIIFPSDYMMDQCIQEGLVQKIDWDQIENAEYLDQDILENCGGIDTDYFVPYFVGNVGIVYDKTVVDEADLEEGWELLRNEKYAGNIYMYDSVRDSFMVALKALGYSMNTTSEEEIDEAYQWLVEQKDIMNPVYVTDTVIDAMVNGEKALAVVYSGDAAYILSENEDMGYFMPSEGTNYWFDGVMITSTCEEVELAHQFINFLCDPDNATDNTLEVGYYSPVVEARDAAIEEMYEDNEAYQLRMGSNDEFFKMQDSDTKAYWANLWTKLLSD